VMTETAGPRNATWFHRVVPPPTPPGPLSVPFDPNTSTISPFLLLDTERQASFFLTGGLVAVHSEGRDRNAIWSALKRREVYGTSGDRILLWFDLINAPSGVLPMGSETALDVAPIFRVRAVGSFKQRPGCPESTTTAVSHDRLDRLCRGECYNPSDERHLIARIDIVRIRPQQRPDEPVASLIDDPWRRYDCPPDPQGCTLQIDDADFAGGGRDALYYARAVQEPTLAINAGELRCNYNEKGECIQPHPCYGDYRTPADDDCLAMNQERAWSSPIYLHR